MHGEPSWSFLYRRMIPVLVDAGLRCVAPDLVGFGRSDKPAERSDYSYARHVEWMRSALLDQLDLHDVTLVGQDWGGLVGLRVAAENPDRFARIVVANTGLPTGDRAPTDAFLAWQRFSQEAEDFPWAASSTAAAPASFARGDRRLRRPLPDDSYKAGARAFPSWCRPARRPGGRRQPSRLGGAGRLGQAAAHRLSDGDPITRGGARPFEKVVPGAQAAPTPPSPARATSSRGTRAPTSPAPSPTVEATPPR
jgi:haloalkane dehalogenase